MDKPIAERPKRTVGFAADQQQGNELLIPRALQPAAMRFAAPETKLSMSAAVISKPSQSLICAKTGARPGPGQPVRVRIIR